MEGCMFRFEHSRSYKAKVANKETQDKRRKADDLVNIGKVPSKIGHVDCLDDDGFPYGCQIELHLLYKCGRAGFSKSGTKRVYNGRTGEMVRSLIFMGPTLYQHLVHMAEEQEKFGNTGPVHSWLQRGVMAFLLLDVDR